MKLTIAGHGHGEVNIEFQLGVQVAIGRKSATKKICSGSRHTRHSRIIFRSWFRVPYPERVNMRQAHYLFFNPNHICFIQVNSFEVPE